MHIKRVLFTLIFLALCSVCYSQIDHSKHWANSGWEYGNEDDSIVEISERLLNQDLSHLLKYPYPQFRSENRQVIPSYGVLGSKYRKIEFLFTNITQNKKNIPKYTIIGNTKLRDSINDLKGELIFTSATAHISKDTSSYTTIVLVGTYNFKETHKKRKVAALSGNVKIVLFTEDYLENPIAFDKGVFYEDGGIKGFVGVRKTKTTSESCLWDFPRYPYEYTNDFDMGAGESMINIAYARTWFDYSDEEWEEILKSDQDALFTYDENGRYIEEHKSNWFDQHKMDHNDLQKLVIKELRLQPEKVAQELIAIKEISNYLNETVVVIPEIENDISNQDEHYYELTSHILIVNSITGEIKNHFQEDSKMNGWISDAISISDITIDVKPNPIHNKENAFGLHVHYRGSSSPNPYNATSYSLYVRENNTIKKVLDNLEVYESIGEINVSGGCAGRFETMKKELSFSYGNMTNGYYDIYIHTKEIETIFKVDTEGECNEKRIRNINSYSILKYNGDTYIEGE